MKSALTYTLTHDKRNDPVVPTRGYFLKWTKEVAGLGGDVKHVKVEAEGQKLYEFSSFVSFLSL